MRIVCFSVRYSFVFFRFFFGREGRGRRGRKGAQFVYVGKCYVLVVIISFVLVARPVTEFLELLSVLQVALVWREDNAGIMGVMSRLSLPDFYYRCVNYSCCN